MNQGEQVYVKVYEVPGGFNIELVSDRTGMTHHAWGASFWVRSSELRNGRYKPRAADPYLSARAAVAVANLMGDNISEMGVPFNSSMFQVRLVHWPTPEDLHVYALPIKILMDQVLEGVAFLGALRVSPGNTEPVGDDTTPNTVVRSSD